MANFKIQIPINSLPCCQFNGTCPELSAAIIHALTSSVVSCGCVNDDSSGPGTSSKFDFTGLNTAYDLVYDTVNGWWAVNVGTYDWKFYSDADCATLDHTQSGTFFAVLKCDGDNYQFNIYLDDISGLSIYEANMPAITDTFTNSTPATACAGGLNNPCGGQTTFTV